MHTPHKLVDYFMQNDHVRQFNEAVLVRRHVEIHVAHAPKLIAAAETAESYDLDRPAYLDGLLNRDDNVGRLTGAGNSHQNITRQGVVGYLLGKHPLVAIVV